MSNLGPKKIHYHRAFCKHRRSLVKRWQENGQWLGILRCRWCDDWQRKVIEMNQDTKNKTVRMLTQKFLEVE